MRPAVITILALLPALALGAEPLRRYPLFDRPAAPPRAVVRHASPTAAPHYLPQLKELPRLPRMPLRTMVSQRLPPMEEPVASPPPGQLLSESDPATLPPPPKSGLEGLEQVVGPAQHALPTEMDCGAHRVPYFREDFGDDPICYELPYDPQGEMSHYDGKTCIPAQRPWLELGRPFYDWGQFPPSSRVFGDANLAAPQVLLYGDFRTAMASNNNNLARENLIASRLNLELDCKLTATERFHTSFQPMNKGQDFTRYEWNSQSSDFEEAFNLDPFTGFFEGDLGAIAGGATGNVMPFDLPIAIGFMPLVFQNGIWMEDNTIGAAATIPARNSALLDISNFDITFFYLFDDVTSPAFQGDKNAGKAYGVAGFYEMLGGYIELDYAFLEDRTALDRSYHNIAAAYTRRYFSFLSNSMRVIYNFGQDPNGIDQTADGVLLLSENSLITADPYLFVPYYNSFVGFGRVQSVARNGAAGGILRNTGILFETDNLTNYPTLDPTGVNTYGGALGLNIIPATIHRQLIVEYAYVGLMDSTDRNVLGSEHGVGARYQQNLTNAWLFRTDAMYGFRAGDNDLSGARMELRYKF
jgi:hypothetical protein